MSTLTEFQYLVEVVRQITLDSIGTLWGRQKFDDEKMKYKQNEITIWFLETVCNPF